MKKNISYKMKKLLIYLLLIAGLNFFSQALAKTYRIGTTFEKNIRFSKNVVLPLSDGKWEVVDRYTDSVAMLYFKGNWIVRVENNEIMEMISIERANLSGSNMGEIDSIVNEIIFKDKYDGCYQRPEYLIVEFYKRGGTHNCLVVRHWDTNKEIYTPDDPSGQRAKFKKWAKDNSIKIPPISFQSWHSYFSRLLRGEWYLIQYVANPKIFNSPAINYVTEESSEFHKANISRHPDHKITMDKWISLSAKRHQFLEKIYKAKENHLLNLNKYIIQNDEKVENNINLTDSLKQLNELYKSGAITEEEFKKAKEKILN
tara:strand:- start:118 stop:1062 length:945 start_codon:yes stop_codon:yes gene_type:complete